MATDEASTRFLDGMRVVTEHMRHLQQASIDRARQLREALGSGGVVHGFQVEPGGGDTLRVSAGLAIDTLGRPIMLPAPVTLPVMGTGTAWLVAVYELKASLLVNGVPTLLANGAKVEARSAAPPYDDGAVPFAELSRGAEGLRLLQRGQWYLPPAQHHHGGKFVTDAAGRWRYDGDAVGGSTAPQFDSGFVALDAGATVELAHGLQSMDVAVELIARQADGVVTNRGLGADYWFELRDAQHIVLARVASESAPALQLRARLWLLGASPEQLARPVADAGDDRTVEAGATFSLDGSRSRAQGGRHLVRYVWTQLS